MSELFHRMILLKPTLNMKKELQSTGASISCDMPWDNADTRQTATHEHSYFHLAYKQNICEQGK